MKSPLKSIYRKRPPGPPEPSGLLIVYVTNTTPNKEEDYRCDLDRFLGSNPGFSLLDCQILLYQYPVRIDDNFHWENLLDSGSDLIEQLHKFCGSEENGFRPLVFVGEGLGGVLVKELWRYRMLVDQLVGIVFLVTPHLGQNEEDTAMKLSIILRQYSKSASQNAITKEMMKPYQICADHFEELGLNIPVMSIFETTEGRLRIGRPGSRKGPLVVDKAFSRTSVLREEFNGLDVSLQQGLDPSVESKTRNKILRFIIDLHDEAQKRISESLRDDLNGPRLPPSMKAPTLVPSVVNETINTPSQRHSSGSSKDAVLLTPSGSGDTRGTPVSGGTGSSLDFVDAMTSLQLEGRTLKFPCYFTKPHARNRHFFHRSDVLRLIEEALIPGNGDPMDTYEQNLRTFVLCGMGGLGKTEISMEFVFSRIKDFDAVFIFHADQVSTLADEYHRAAVQLGLQQSSKMDPQDSRELLKAWLADPQKAPERSYGLNPSSPAVEQGLAKWLIVFDNADDPSVLSEYWPTDGKGSILITSRDPMAKSTFFFGDTGHELKQMTTAESANWIVELTDANITDPDVSSAANTVAKQLDGLPLAIIQVTSIIRMRQLNLVEFVELYENETESPEFQAMRVGNRRGYEHNLASVWALGILEPGPLTLLGVISMLDPDAIPEEILKTSMATENYPNYPKDAREFRQVLQPLLQSSIVQRNAANAELRLHRLVTDVARAKMQTMGQLREIFDLAVNLVCSVWPFWRMGAKAGQTHNVDRWGQSAKLYPHVYRLFRRFPRIKQQVGSLVPFEKFADLLIEAAWYQFERSNFSEPNPLLDLAEQICLTLKPNKYEQLSIISACRFAMQQWKNNGEGALIHAERYLEFQKLSNAHLGKETTELSYGFYAVGVSLRMCKLYSKAIPYLVEAIDIRKRLPGFKPNDIFSPMFHQALASFSQGRIDECESLLLEALAARYAAVGKNDMSSYRPGNIFYTLGHVYATRKMMDESFKCHTQALNHFSATVGESHIFTAHACGRVAEHHLRRGETDQARTLLDQAIRIYQDKPYFKDELARAYYLYAQLLAKRAGTASEALDMLNSAAICLHEIHPHIEYVGLELKEENFIGLGQLGFS